MCEDIFLGVVPTAVAQAFVLSGAYGELRPFD